MYPFCWFTSSSPVLTHSVTSKIDITACNRSYIGIAYHGTHTIVSYIVTSYLIALGLPQLQAGIPVGNRGKKQNNV